MIAASIERQDKLSEEALEGLKLIYLFLMYYSENYNPINLRRIEAIWDRFKNKEIVEIHQLLQKKQLGIFQRRMSEQEINRNLQNRHFSERYLIAIFSQIADQFFSQGLDQFSPGGNSVNGVFYDWTLIRNEIRFTATDSYSFEAIASSLRRKIDTEFARLKRTGVIAWEPIKVNSSLFTQN